VALKFSLDPAYGVHDLNSEEVKVERRDKFQKGSKILIQKIYLNLFEFFSSLYLGIDDGSVNKLSRISVEELGCGLEVFVGSGIRSP